MDDSLRAEIEALRIMKTKALKARYRELFGEESGSFNRAHLFRRVAWRLQALAGGGLSERARKRAAELATDVDIRLRPSQQFWRDLEERPKIDRDARLPLPGSEITREYRGQLLRVLVLHDGFEFNGQKYDSLSSIASQATGTRWNGFQFFRLGKGPDNA